MAYLNEQIPRDVEAVEILSRTWAQGAKEYYTAPPAAPRLLRTLDDFVDAVMLVEGDPCTKRLKIRSYLAMYALLNSGNNSAATPAAGERGIAAETWLIRNVVDVHKYGVLGRGGFAFTWKDVREMLESFTAELRVQLAAAQNRSDLNAENVRLREALEKLLAAIQNYEIAHVRQLKRELISVMISARAALQKGSAS